MFIAYAVSRVFPVLTLASHLGIALFALLILFSQKKRRSIFDFIKKDVLFFALVVSLAATAGSLFYSEVLGYEPCRLCWYQRIFMYPLPLIFGLALVLKDRRVLSYTLVISLAGGTISLYHYLIQISQANAPCPIDGVSCTQGFFHYGYITISMMALTAFALVAFLSFAGRKLK